MTSISERPVDIGKRFEAIMLDHDLKNADDACWKVVLLI